MRNKEQINRKKNNKKKSVDKFIEKNWSNIKMREKIWQNNKYKKMGQYLKTNYVKKSIEKIDSEDLK